MSYNQVAQALANGADPDMLCMTCPWDRFRIQPPSMTKSEVDAKIAEAQREDERRAKAAGGKSGPPMNTLLTAVTIGGMHTTAAICPVLAMRLRLAEGRDIVDLIKTHMQSRKSD